VVYGLTCVDYAAGPQKSKPTASSLNEVARLEHDGVPAFDVDRPARARRTPAAFRGDVFGLRELAFVGRGAYAPTSIPNLVALRDLVPGPQNRESTWSTNR